MDYNSIGDKIRRLRKENNLTQEVLAEQLNISYTYLSQLERGVRGISVDVLVSVANRFSVSVDFLLSDYLNKHIGRESREIDNDLFRIIESKTPAEKRKLVNMIKDINKYL